MLTSGLILTFATGVVWAAVGVCFSHVARRQVNLSGFIFLYSLLFSMIAWICFPDYRVLMQQSGSELGWIIVIMLFSGAAGLAGVGMMKLAMDVGHHGVIWALGQGAVVMPCLFGMIFFKEMPGAWGKAGFISFMIGMLVLAFIRKGKLSNNSHWICFAIGASLLIGISQILSLLPSYLSGLEGCRSLRVPLTASAGLFWVVPVCLNGNVDFRKIVGLSLIYALLVLAGQYLLYHALDRMSASACGALTYPLAIGVCIIVFAGYSHWYLREESGRGVLTGLGLTASGIILMTISK